MKKRGTPEQFSGRDYHERDHRIMEIKKKKIDVAVLGATGAVGQKFITLLESHPYFSLRELVASERSAGKPYREACRWHQKTLLSETTGTIVVKDGKAPLSSPLLFSGLDASVAGDYEKHYAEKGHTVVSNAKNHRMDPRVPLVIPELNQDHLALLEQQSSAGRIITNSNCSTMFAAMALYPVHQQWGLEQVQITTMQAVSGAGYPGVASLDILGNVVPYIGGEEEKMEEELRKILGTLRKGSVEPADFKVSAQCNRVPVYDGHTETLSFRCKTKPSPEEVRELYRNYRVPPETEDLPSSPRKFFLLFSEEDRPQPRQDCDREKGMCVNIGRIRSCPVNHIKMVIMGHNTLRGAAGAAVLNAELLFRQGHFQSA